jgi:hypothetical protein
MAIRWKQSMRIVFGCMLAILGLSGCGGALCPTYLSPLEIAARYPTRTSPDTGRTYYALARDAWVDNQEMTAFLRGAVASGGVDGLVSEHQFQCTPRPAEENCLECYTCKRAVPVRYSDVWMLRGLCVDAGDVLVQAYIGPGRAVRAMTYWSKKNPPTK